MGWGEGFIRSFCLCYVCSFSFSFVEPTHSPLLPQSSFLFTFLPQCSVGSVPPPPFNFIPRSFGVTAPPPEF